MKITILGWYDQKNIGDEAYKLAFPILFPNHELTFTDNPTNSPEIIILGGGDILNKQFYATLDKFPSAIKYAMSVDLHTNKMPIDRFKQVFTRNISPSYLPDFTFVLTPNPENGKILIDNLFKKQKAEKYNKTVLVVLNNYLATRENSLARDHLTFEKNCFDLARLIDNTSASFIFLPFGNGFPHNDRISNSYLYSKCKFWKKNAIVYENYTVQETLDICAAVDVTISSRLHSSIFSCMGGTPIINLCHHDKTRLFLESIFKDEWNVNYWNLDLNKIKSLLNEFLNKNEHRADLLKIAAINKKILLESSLQTLFE